MNKTELKPNVEAHAHNPVLRRREDLKLKGSLCCMLSSNTILVIVSQNIRKQLTRTNKTKPRPPKIINQMNKIQIKAMKGWSRGRLFSYLCSRRSLKLIQHTRKQKFIRLGFIKALA